MKFSKTCVLLIYGKKILGPAEDSQQTVLVDSRDIFPIRVWNARDCFAGLAFPIGYIFFLQKKNIFLRL